MQNNYGKKSEHDLLNFINDLESDSVIWDIGANIGYFSIYAAQKGHSVLSFEPDQLTINALNKNIFLNNVNSRCFALPIALNDENLVSTLNLPTFIPAQAHNSFDRNVDLWGENFNPSFNMGALGIRADSIKFSDKLRNFAIPLFVKIDVDGNEYKVLKGFGSLLKRIKYISIELTPIHDEYGLVLNLLNQFNFDEIMDVRYLDYREREHNMRNYYFKNKDL